jgi:hypothetical protein
MNRTQRTLQARFDRQAVEQLRAEVAALAARIDQLENELYWAQQAASDADTWHDLAMDLMYETDRRVGITKDGQMGLIK